MEKSFLKLFNETIERGEKIGVKWSDAKLMDYTIDTSAMKDSNIKASNLGLKSMKGVINFSSNGTDYQMEFDKVMWMPGENGWLGIDIVQVVKKGRLVTVEPISHDPSAKRTDAKKPLIQSKPSNTKSPAQKSKTKV